MMVNHKAEGVVVAELNLYKDGSYDFTGRTFSANAGPDASSTEFKPEELIAYADRAFGKEWQGIQVMGNLNFVHIK